MLRPSTILLISLLCYTSYGYNILIMGVFPFNSHLMMLSALANELATQGHNVTFVTVKPTNPHPRINLIKNDDFMGKHLTNDFIKNLGTMSPQEFLEAIFRIGLQSADDALSSDVLKELINAPIDGGSGAKDANKYDAVLTESYFLSETFAAGFSLKHNCSLISYNPVVMQSNVAYMIGNPYNPSYMVDYKFQFTSNMNFFQRLRNLYLVAHHMFHYNVLYLPQQDKLMRKHFAPLGAYNWPYIKDILQDRQALTLVDANLLVTDALPYNPNVIEVGGLQIKPGKPLPKELDDFINSSGEHGVVYFAMGSHVDIKIMDESRKEILRKLLASLKQKVIWSMKDEELSKKLSPNVLTGKWFSQNDILAHPKCKLFITHGGVHSFFETVYHGVPVLVLPMFADQFQNGHRASEKGYGEIIEEFALEEMTRKINKVLYEPRYKQSMKAASEIFKSNPLHPLQKAIQHIEYVIKTNGAPHWKTAATRLAWYQLLMLDVILFLLLVTSVALYIVYRGVSYVRSLVSLRKQGSASSSTRKKNK